MKWAVISVNFSLLIYMFMPINSKDESVGKKIPNRLTKILSDASHLDTLLDLSQKNICCLHVDDFRLFTKLSILNLSHNQIEEFEFEVFQFNTALEQLDLSYNKLTIMRCTSLHLIKNLKTLNLSYNNFATMYICKEISLLSKLEYLGLSAAQIQKLDFINIAHRELRYVFLGIENLQEYEVGSLQLLNTSKLHITLPIYLQSPFLLHDALNTSTTLEISQITCDAYFCDYPTSALSKINKHSKVSTLILSNITMPWNGMSTVLQAVWRSSVQHLYIYTYTLVHEFVYKQKDFSNGSLKSLVIDHVIQKVFFFTPPHPLNIFSEMLVENFTFSNADITHLFCPPWPSIFRTLNLSKNRITHEIFKECDNLTALELLNLQSNRLQKISKVISMTSTMKSLKHLDLSQNIIDYDQIEKCNWTESLVFLNLSENRITTEVFACLPINVQILDLSMNQITSVSKGLEQLTFLRELNLASNHLKDIPDCHLMSRNLRVLNVDDNGIYSPSVAFYQSCQYIEILSAGRNPFQCNCELREFTHIEKMTPGKLSGWPDSYSCKYPEDFKGVLLKDFYVSEISCNIYILLGIVLGILLVVLVIIIFSCKYFDLPWYIRMLFLWIRTKHRVKNINKQELGKSKRFHAFISYSEEDSEWVKNVLIPNLEKSDGSIKLCHHEKHFIPGKTIVKNIILCVEQSFKSIFVLSPNFIQSKWCHYELHFAQHALFGKNFYNLILILLNPIPQYLIPNKYTRLKAIMKQRTYLEWPKERGKHALFWANLREAIGVNLTSDEEEDIDWDFKGAVTPV
ncbi:toll-like receptor 1 [Pelobates fuscus]|uniref:toll-like receptor 1 n=1 Tax=Pelobates fuscus TaxID=191477 RepID=UPI002FE4874E